MAYALVDDETLVNYPHTVDQFRQDNPNVSLPQVPTKEQLREVGLVVVLDVLPALSPGERPGEATVAYSAEHSRWERTWEAVEITGEELAPLREVLKTKVNTKRDEIEISVATTSFGVVQMDAVSSKHLEALRGAATTSLIAGVPWDDTIVWSMADNSEAAIDTPAKALQLAGEATGYSAALHKHAKLLKAQLDAAETAAELMAVDIESNWP